MLKVVEVARKAVASGDYDVLKTNLEVLNEVLKKLDNDKKKHRKINIDEDDLFALEATTHNIRYMVDKETHRRENIADVSKKYDAAKAQLSKCEELFEFYSNILNAPTDYSTSPKDSEREKILKEFFGLIQKELGLNKKLKSLEDVNAQIAELEKSIDGYVFTINKLNGVYDEKVAKEDLQRAEALKPTEKTLKELNENLKSQVSPSEYKKYTGKDRTKKINSKIATLKKIPQDEITPEETQLLELLEQLSANEEFEELESMYEKYGVTSIEEMQSVLSNHEVENTNEPNAQTPSRLITSDLVERTEDSHVSAKEGIRVIKKLDSKSIGKDLDETTIDLRYNGYVPCVGKDSAIYARPVYKRPIFGKFGKPKLVGMELVEESIESLTKSPEDAYAKALKELKARSEMLENGPVITNDQIAKMKKAFSELIKDSRYDEAVKRIIAAQTSMTRTDLANFARQHSKTHDSSGKTTVTFPGGEENYKAPHIPVKTKFFGLARIPQKPDPNAPNEAVVAPKDTQYLKDANISSPSKPVVSKNVLRDRTHYKETSKEDERDEI